ncbi:hypothetical protein ACHHYP_14463 [Achlya hypogyna]|uniref:Uncharacterized protein n=1 Tax=Achlya hypogyna TaxID=1202772 RepID=A0A1V9ZF54_ACHHY|nr:hypothetical protein ACHHYP_14463 [Achlya hypogyna]
MTLSAKTILRPSLVEPGVSVLRNTEPTKHRRLTLQTAPPSDPFLLDNRFLGDVTVESHPIFGSATLSITSSGLFRVVSTVSASGAPVSATWIPTSTDVSKLVDIGDVLYINDVELRSVVAVNSSAIQIDRGLQFALAGQEPLHVKSALISASEGATAPLASVSALGLQVSSTDTSTDTVGAHTTARFVHYSSGSSSRLVRLPGTGTVTRGSDAVYTSMDLTSALRANTYIRLAGATYIVNPTKPFNASMLYLDRPYSGPTFAGIPLHLEALGAAVVLKAVGNDNTLTAGSLEAVFGSDAPILRLATATSNSTDEPLTTRVHVSSKGVALVGGANAITTEFGDLNIKAASSVNVQAGTDEASMTGGNVVLGAVLRLR